MIISEKQIIGLINFSKELRRELLQGKLLKNLTPTGENSLKNVGELLDAIFNQQPKELKELKKIK